MKANELMIGDWVDFYHPHEPEKKIVTRHRVTETFECGLVELNNHPNPVHADHIEPVKITPEILEKNGWKHEFDKKDYMVKYNLGEEGKNCWMMWAIKEHNLDIQRQDENLDVYNLKVSKVSIPCDYVHQLQHALRLCGIEKEIIL